MNEPNKYEYVSDGYTARFINPKTGHAAPYGEYVRYEDYARLKAEVKKWQRCESVACDKMLELCGEIKRLKAEVERLTKAGDAMASILQFEERLYHDDAQDPECVKAWNAAKEGKQS